MLHLIPRQRHKIATRSIRLRIRMQLRHLWSCQSFRLASAALCPLFKHLLMMHNCLPVEISPQRGDWWALVTIRTRLICSFCGRTLVYCLYLAVHFERPEIEGLRLAPVSLGYWIIFGARDVSLGLALAPLPFRRSIDLLNYFTLCSRIIDWIVKTEYSFSAVALGHVLIISADWSYVQELIKS